MSMIKGQLSELYPAQNMTGKDGRTFTRRDFSFAVLEPDRETRTMRPNPSNTPLLTAFGRVVDDLARLRVGDMIEVGFLLQGRKYIDRDGAERYFTSVRVTSVSPAGPLTVCSSDGL